MDSRTAPEADPADTARRRSVLYVEDHPVNLLLMGAIFDRRPALQLVTATTGEQALCIAAGLDPVLLLLDLRLPDCHGSHLLPLLRQVGGWDAVPAVAVTADTDFDIAGSGFDALWLKPLRLERVLADIDALTAPDAGPVRRLPGRAGRLPDSARAQAQALPESEHGSRTGRASWPPERGLSFNSLSQGDTA